MTKAELSRNIYAKKSCLAIGLDVDVERIPRHLTEQYEDPVFEFNKQIIDRTHDLCVCYKLNIAFYESQGLVGWTSLARTLEYIPRDIFTIADAKRGDIGNTSRMYAKTFFELHDFDSITASPYMGVDSIRPFLDFPEKWVILLALTSNEGSEDFQYHTDARGEKLYEKVIRVSQTWGDEQRMMYVVGATHPRQLAEIRQSIPGHFLLIPGVGAQGGSVQEVMDAAYVPGDCGLLINSSRGVIYAGDGEDFADKARKSARILQEQMAPYLV